MFNLIIALNLIKKPSAIKSAVKKSTSFEISFNKPWFTAGCMDMAGNVWEWRADWYDEKYYQQSPTQNPPGPTSGEYRVLRGGSLIHRAVSLRSSYRLRDNPGGRDGSVGFRVVCVVVLLGVKTVIRGVVQGRNSRESRVTSRNA